MYAERIKQWKTKGYEIVIFFLRLSSVEMAIDRVKARAERGGHSVPERDIRRRFERSWTNFQTIYRELADAWVIFDTSEYEPRIIEESE